MKKLSADSPKNEYQLQVLFVSYILFQKHVNRELVCEFEINSTKITLLREYLKINVGFFELFKELNLVLNLATHSPKAF